MHDAEEMALRERVDSPTSLGFGVTHYKQDMRWALQEIDRLRAEVKDARDGMARLNSGIEHWKAEIDRLRAQVDSAKNLVLNMDIKLLKVEEENAKLREALENVAKWHKRSLPTPWGHACNWCSECCNKALKPLYEIFCRTT